MLREHSIVLSQETPNYRKLAQISWGLTDEQMSGMHVHHHPPRSQGGRNIPEHLYVCSEEMHFVGWHKGSPHLTITRHASAAGKACHQVVNEEGKSVQALKNTEVLHSEKDEFGRSIQGVKNAERLHAEKDEFGRSIQGVKAGERLKQFAALAGTKAATTMWEDPLHPEIGFHNAGNLVQRQKKLGLPHGKENRRRCTSSQPSV